MSEVIKKRLLLSLTLLIILVQYNKNMDKNLEEAVDQVFAHYDRNKNGTLEVKEIKFFLNDCYAKVGKKSSGFSEVTDLLNNYDFNKNGVIEKK